MNAEFDIVDDEGDEIGDNEFRFYMTPPLTEEPREVLRFIRAPDGKLDIIVKGDLTQAAREFLYCIRNLFDDVKVIDDTKGSA